MIYHNNSKIPPLLLDAMVCYYSVKDRIYSYTHIHTQELSQNNKHFLMRQYLNFFSKVSADSGESKGRAELTVELIIDFRILTPESV